MSGKKEKRRHERNVLLATIGLVLTAGLLILLALYLLFGGRKEQEPVVSAVQDSQEELSQKTEEETEEDPQASYEPEETGTPVEISTVKEVAGETDETTTGIDVSEFQGNIDWDQVADTGIDFVMVRVGYRTAGSGEIREDACARYNLQEASARGIHLGAYFFSTAVTEEEAREEARWVCEFLAGYPVTYPVAYNCEGFQSESSRQYGMSAEDRSALAQVFLDEVEAGGYTGMFYAAK